MAAVHFRMLNQWKTVVGKHRGMVINNRRIWAAECSWGKVWTVTEFLSHTVYSCIKEFTTNPCILS